MKKLRKSRPIAAHCIREIVHRLLREITTEHRADPIELHWNSRRLRSLFHSNFKLRSELFQSLVGIALREFLQRGDSSRHGQWIPTERSRLINGAQWREVIHNVPATAESTDRTSAANNFAETTADWPDAESPTSSPLCRNCTFGLSATTAPRTESTAPFSLRVDWVFRSLSRAPPLLSRRL